jgi:hypothetical protein
MNASKGEMKEKLDPNQEEIKVIKEEMKEDMRTGRAEMNATVSAIQEIWSPLQKGWSS